MSKAAAPKNKIYQDAALSELRQYPKDRSGFSDFVYYCYQIA